jgi:biotin transport system substrate-specific component
MQTTLPRLWSTRLSAAPALPVRLSLGLLATLFVAVAAHISIPLPFTPVPLTMQPFAVLCVGLAFGPLGGALTMLAYLAEGACGLPVFSPTGPGGLAQLAGPTGGFLLSYPFVAAIAGGMTATLTRALPRFAAALLGCTAAVIVLFACGAAWLAHEANLSAHTVWLAAVGPFLPGEAIKILAAAGLYRALSRPATSERA